MASPRSLTLPEPSAVLTALFSSAKRWWSVTLAIKLLAFGLSVLSILVATIPSEVVAPAVVILTIVAEIATYKADALKGDAQLMRRRLDFSDALGWPISSPEYSDLLARRTALLMHSQRSSSDEEYFASTQGQGPSRAVENTMESAWWTKHLCRTMALYCLISTLGALALSLATLYFALIGTSTPNTRIVVAKLVSALLAFVFSFGLARLTVSYWQLNQKASRTEHAALHILNTVSEIDAITLMQEYDLARAAGPLIPTWHWRRSRDTLGPLWEQYRVRR